MDTLVQKLLIANAPVGRFVFALSFERLLSCQERLSMDAQNRVRGSFHSFKHYFLRFYKKLRPVPWKTTSD